RAESGSSASAGTRRASGAARSGDSTGGDGAPGSGDDDDGAARAARGRSRVGTAGGARRGPALEGRSRLTPATEETHSDRQGRRFAEHDRSFYTPSREGSPARFGGVFRRR